MQSHSFIVAFVVCGFGMITKTLFPRSMWWNIFAIVSSSKCTALDIICKCSIFFNLIRLLEMIRYGSVFILLFTGIEYLTETVEERKGLFSLSVMAGAAGNGSLRKHEALVTRNSSQDTEGLDSRNPQGPFPSYPLLLLRLLPRGSSFPKAPSGDQVFKHRSLTGLFHFKQ